MILIQIVRSIALLLTQTVFTNSPTQSDANILSKSSVIPKEQQEQVNNLSINVENLHNEAEEKLGAYFKIINLFCTIAEQNTDMLNRYGQSVVLTPLTIFTALFRLRYLKELMMPFLRQVSAVVKGVTQTQSTMLSLDDNEELQQSYKFDEQMFLEKVKGTSTTIEINELNGWIREFDGQLYQCKSILSISDNDLIPVFDVMTQLFEDKIEEFIDSGNLSMKELQAFYKIRTKILHSRINELHKLVDNQNEDIRMTKSHYTDELINLKDEVSDIKNMAGQLEYLQQSADFYMNGASVVNNNLGHFGNSFEHHDRGQLQRSNYASAHNISGSNQKYGFASRVEASPKQYSSNNQYRNQYRKQITDKNSTRKDVSRNTDLLSHISHKESRSNSYISGLDNNQASYSITNNNRSQIQKRLLYSIDQEIDTGKFGEQQLNDILFSQSPIHGAQTATKSNIFQSMDEYMSNMEKGNYQSNRKNNKIDEAMIEETPTSQQISTFSKQMTQQEVPKIQVNFANNQPKEKVLNNIDEPQETYQSTIPSHPGTYRNTGRNHDYYNTQDDDFEDLLEQRIPSSNEETGDRCNYLDQSLDKLEGNVNDEIDAYDINPSESDYGTSIRSPDSSRNSNRTNKLHRLMPDRMTPEFKLSSEDPNSRNSLRNSGKVSPFINPVNLNIHSYTGRGTFTGSPDSANIVVNTD